MIQCPVSPLSPLAGGASLGEPFEMPSPVQYCKPISDVCENVRSLEQTAFEWDEAMVEVMESLQWAEKCVATYEAWEKTVENYRDKWYEVEGNIDLTSCRWEQSKLSRLSVRLRAFTNDARTRWNQSLRMKIEAIQRSRLSIIRFQTVDYSLRRGLPYDVALRANLLLSDDDHGDSDRSDQ